jgi:hypothetical protein
VRVRRWALAYRTVTNVVAVRRLGGSYAQPSGRQKRSRHNPSPHSLMFHKSRHVNGWLGCHHDSPSPAKMAASAGQAAYSVPVRGRKHGAEASWPAAMSSSPGASLCPDPASMHAYDTLTFTPQLFRAKYPLLSRPNCTQ